MRGADFDRLSHGRCSRREAQHLPRLRLAPPCSHARSQVAVAELRVVRRCSRTPMKTTLILILSLLCVARSCFAADLSRDELAMKLVTVMRVGDRNRSELSDALPKLKESNPKTDAFWQEVVAGHARLYSDAYTASELQQLITFFESPIGQTFLDRQRELIIKGRKTDSSRVMELFMDAKSK